MGRAATAAGWGSIVDPVSEAMNYSLARLAAGRYQLRMQGPCYSVNWMATLSASLSALRVGITEANVTSEEAHAWTADFLLDFRRSQVRAEALDYVALTQRKPTAVITEAPQLLRFALIRRADSSIRISVDAEDHGGFQERLLARIAGLGLYPVGMKLRKTGPSIRTSFALRGIGGRPPGEDAAGALETLLRRMQVHREGLLPATAIKAIPLSDLYQGQEASG